MLFANITGVIGGMAPLSDLASPGAVRLRILSAAVLAPVALAGIWIGPPLLSFLAVSAAAIMGWEWGRLCGTRGHSALRALIIGVEIAGVGAGACQWLDPGLGFLPSLVLLLAGAATVFIMGNRQSAAIGWWSAGGTLWIGMPCLALLWLRGASGGGRELLLWIFGVVWATDIAAYAVGKGVGGPRLAPIWSPGKTWAGFIGGVVGAGLIGIIFGRILSPHFARLIWLAPFFGLVGQMGDLAESIAKRRFGVKDVSGLIPGHGGLLDRLDAMLAVLAALAVTTLFWPGAS